MKSFLEHVEELRQHTLDLARSANLSFSKKPSALKGAQDNLITQRARMQGYNVNVINGLKITTPQNPKDPGSQQIPFGQNTHSLKPSLSPEQIETAAKEAITARKEYRKQKLLLKKK